VKKVDTPHVPISLCLIAKNEEANVVPFWNSVKDMLNSPGDEVVLVDTGSTDNTVTEAEKCGWNVISRKDLCSTKIAHYGKEWKPDHWYKFHQHPHFNNGVLRSFAEARQISFDAAKNEVCMWLDLDDSLVNGKHLRDMIDEVIKKTPINKGAVVFLRYDYSFDKNGTCNTTLWRERIVTKRHFKWKGLCHETLLPIGDGHIMARDVNCPTVVQHRAPKDHEFSDLRNYIILRKDYVVDKNEDPRTLFYLGNACRGLKDYSEAVSWYNSFVKRSGSKEDVMAARLNNAYCLSEMGMNWKALKECTEAQLVDCEDPRPFYSAAAMWAKLGHWKNVITNVRLGDQFQLKDTMHAVDPHMVTTHPALLITQAYRELNMPEAAMEAAKRMMEAGKVSERTVQLYNDLKRWARAEIASQNVFKALKQAKNPMKALKEFKISPHLLDRGVRDVETKQPGDTKKTTIAFYCGQSATRWGPPSIEKGVGASEKMVYEAAKGLVKKGFNVQVYCRLNREEGQCKDGIHWRYSGRYNPLEYRDIVVIWRMPGLVNKMPIECNKLYVWMHDVGDPNLWTNATLEKIDKVLFLSEYQRNLHPRVPDNKVYITRNGIDLAEHLYKGGSKSKKIIYCSSPDRGWLTAIEIFKRSKLADKGYTLHMFYGFGELFKQMAAIQGWGHIVELEHECRMYEYENWCRLGAASTPGVVYRGAVGWKEMAKEMQDAEMWLYPTKFQEISCVAAMEAMAAGCKCVSTDHAALKETLKDYPGLFLVDLKKEHAEEALIKAEMTPFDPFKGSAFARKFDMNKLIDEWTKDLMEVEKDDFRPIDNRGPASDGTQRLNIC